VSKKIRREWGPVDWIVLAGLILMGSAIAPAILFWSGCGIHRTGTYVVGPDGKTRVVAEALVIPLKRAPEMRTAPEPWEAAIQEAAREACASWDLWVDHGVGEAYFGWRKWDDELERRMNRYREEMDAAMPAGWQAWRDHVRDAHRNHQPCDWPPPWLRGDRLEPMPVEVTP